MTDIEALRTTPLHGLHRELGGRLVDFAGWELPIQYEGVIAEHTWCRAGAALFDVSHMGVVELRSPAGTAADVAHHLEALTPAAVATLEPGRQRYGLLTSDEGGIIDDLIITNRGDHLMLVVNASRRQVDLDHLRAGLPAVTVNERPDVALLALQGPRAVEALARLVPEVAGLVFLDHIVVEGLMAEGVAAAAGLAAGADGAARSGPLGPLGVSRSGYTGEDGFELMVAAEWAELVARCLLAQPEVKPAGLGARDTLRLEAGLPLYGHDLDLTTSPVEADLAWTVPRRRRDDARFPGAARILAELADGPTRRRVGLSVTGRRPVRDGATLRVPSPGPAGPHPDPTGPDAGTSARTGAGPGIAVVSVGTVTSGGYGPTVGAPVAMGYVAAELATPGQVLVADVRGTDVEVVVAPLPFSPHHYHRGVR